MQLLCATGISSMAVDVAIGVLLGFVTLAVLLIVFHSLIKVSGQEKGRKVTKSLMIILLVGGVLRLLLSLLVTGHRRELFETVYSTLEDHSYFEANYNPANRLYTLTYYVLALFTFPATASGLSFDSLTANVLIKLPFLISDLLTAYLLYRASVKYANEKTGLVMATLVCFCPVFFFASSLWASTLCLLLPVLLASLTCLVSKKDVLAIVLFACCLLIAKEAMFVLPVYLVYYVRTWIRMLIKNRNGEADDKQKKLIWVLPVTFVSCMIGSYLIALPYAGAIVGTDFFKVFEFLFVTPFADNVYFANNQPSLFALFGNNAQKLDESVNQAVFTLVFLCLVGIISALIYHSKKNRAVTVLIAAFALLTGYVYFIGLTAYSVLPFIVVMSFAYVLIKDRRILRTIAVSAILTIALAAAIYVLAGYYNTLPIEIFKGNPANTGYTGSTWLWKSTNPVIVVFAVLQLINHAYFVFYAFDITVTNNVLPLPVDKEAGFGVTLRSMFTNK